MRPNPCKCGFSSFVHDRRGRPCFRIVFVPWSLGAFRHPFRQTNSSSPQTFWGMDQVLVQRVISRFPIRKRLATKEANNIVLLVSGRRIEESSSGQLRTNNKGRGICYSAINFFCSGDGSKMHVMELNIYLLPRVVNWH
jgi:hypothetical protein